MAFILHGAMRRRHLSLALLLPLAEVLHRERLRHFLVLQFDRLALSRGSGSPSPHGLGRARHPFAGETSLGRVGPTRTLWGIQRVFRRSEDKLGKLHETGPLMLLKLQHEADNLNDMVRIPLLQLGQTRIDQSFSIIDLVPLVEACNVLHGGALIKDQTA